MAVTVLLPRVGWPRIIQGGMGIGVSGWRLARAVSVTGQLGVVSGVALDNLVVRRLQLGDAGGHVRRALAKYPFPCVADELLERYFVDGGIPPDAPFALGPKPSVHPHRRASELVTAANFVEIFLAKEGHDGVVGVNYLEKLQMSTPAAVYGAMLAGVDYVLVGAGIPAEFPALLGELAAGRSGRISIDVVGDQSIPLTVQVTLPSAGHEPVELRRPRFLAIVASHVLASFLARDERTRPDGFVVESPEAGGHSAPPRGPLTLDERGQPVYGPRDVADLDKLRDLGLPFWLAGASAHPKRLAEALALGAAGVQIGSAFALCEESGLAPHWRTQIIERELAGDLRVLADPTASPTGFPFKVAELPGTVADPAVSARRHRICDAGYLRVPYRKADGELGYRCSAEPVAAYVRKGGNPEEADGRQCLCNGLIAATGLGQRRRSGGTEPAIVTIGQDLSFLPNLVHRWGARSYRAAEVVAYLLGEEN